MIILLMNKTFIKLKIYLEMVFLLKFFINKLNNFKKGYLMDKNEIFIEELNFEGR